MNDSEPGRARSEAEPARSGSVRGLKVGLWQLGLYALAVGIVSVLVLLIVYQAIARGRVARSLIFVTLLSTGLFWGLLRDRSGGFDEPDGLRIERVEPHLAELVRRIASAVGGPEPDAIYLVPDCEVYAVEDSRMFGMRIRSSALAIGMPLVEVLTTRELAALIAHELAHQSEIGPPAGSNAYRALTYASRLIANERKGFIDGVAGNYARKMFRSIGADGAAQEAAADRAAAELCGTEALRSALHTLDHVVAAYDRFLREYVAPAFAQGLHPLGLFAGFGEMLASPARADERRGDLERRDEAGSGQFELHRTPAERLAAMDRLPATAGSHDLDDRPGRELLDVDAKSGEILVGRWASKLTSGRTEARTWQQLTDEVYVPALHELSAAPFGGAATTGDDDDDCDAGAGARLERLLDLAAGDGWDEIQPVLDKALRRTAAEDRRAAWAAAVVATAAAQHDGFTWHHTWDGPPELHTPEGTAFDPAPIAALIVSGDTDAARTRLHEALTR